MKPEIEGEAGHRGTVPRPGGRPPVAGLVVVLLGFVLLQTVVWNALCPTIPSLDWLHTWKAIEGIHLPWLRGEGVFPALVARWLAANPVEPAASTLLALHLWLAGPGHLLLVNLTYWALGTALIVWLVGREHGRLAALGAGLVMVGLPGAMQLSRSLMVEYSLMAAIPIGLVGLVMAERSTSHGRTAA